VSEVHDTELWSEIVGQPAGVQQLRAASASPVHAYLIVGPEGSGKRAAARAFAGDLLAAGLDGEAAERARRLAGAEAHPAMMVVERDGASIAVAQADEIVRQASLAPAEGAVQVVVLVDFHLVGTAAPKLLKSIEEPPPTTVFVVLAEEVTPALVTIASRCVTVEFAAVAESVLAERLLADGVDAEHARVAASGAGGSLSRARLLARDPAAAARRAAWYDAADRLDGTGATACVVADELMESIEGVLAPLGVLQAEELARFTEGFERAGIEPRKSDLKRLEDRHKREQRRVRVDELRSGLATLLSSYRDRLAGGGSHEDFLSAADAVQVLCDGLAFNPNEGLQLRSVLVQLPVASPVH